MHKSRNINRKSKFILAISFMLHVGGLGQACAQIIDTSGETDPYLQATYQVSSSYDLFQTFVTPTGFNTLSVVRFTALGGTGDGQLSIRPFDGYTSSFAGSQYSTTFDATSASPITLQPKLTLDPTKTYAVYWQASGPVTYSLNTVWSPSTHVYPNGLLGFAATSGAYVYTDPTGSYVLYLSFVPLGPDATNTLAGLSSNANALHRLMDSRLSSLALMISYDCQTFDANGMCLSFQARYSSFDSSSDGAGVLTAAYRLNDYIRLGAFMDYRVVEKEPVGLKLSHDLPTVGAFAGYSQNLDGTGLQAKVAAAFNTGQVIVTRSDALPGTEPGAGKANLNSYLLSGEIGWGFAAAPSIVATPYLGLRYGNASRGNYVEGVTESVTYPISYAEFTERLTTATAGIRFAGS